MSSYASDLRAALEADKRREPFDPSDPERSVRATADLVHTVRHQLAGALDRLEQLERVAEELAAALRKHRADMHNTSPRPCKTCAQSATALGHFDALDREAR